MPIKTVKFGGSSLADANQFRKVAAIINADPDRRSAEGRKLVRLEDCSPDVVALRPLIERVAPRLCLKNSPLFDVDEALNRFPESHVEVLSLGGECKEVLIYVGEGISHRLTATE